MGNFISQSTPVTATHWNDIIKDADNYLTTMCGGMSPLLAAPGAPNTLVNVNAGIDIQWDRAFFIGWSPVNPPSSSLHPWAQLLFTRPPTVYQGAVVGPQPMMYFRKYDHNAITSIVAGCATTGSPQLGCQRLTKPTWNVWSASIYPEGFSVYGDPTNAMSDGTGHIADNLLDCSLGVIKRSGYNVTFKDISTAEHEQPLKPIDVFIIGNLTWDTTNWDKYSIVRVHNCSRGSVTATFGSVTASLNPAAAKCFRKYNGSWYAEGNYFHYMHSGDGRYMMLKEATGGGCTVTQPGICFDVMHNLILLGYEGTDNGYQTMGNTMPLTVDIDATKLWDYSGIANNVTYSASPPELTPPAGGYFGSLNNSTMLGDLLVHKGNFLLYFSDFATSGSGGYYTIPFTGFANYSSAFAPYLSASHFGVRTCVQDTSGLIATGTVNNLELYGTGPATVANGVLADISSPLASFLSIGAAPAIKIGANTGSNPPSVLLPLLRFGCTSMTSWIENDVWYGPLNAVTSSITRWQTFQINKAFTPLNTVSDVITWLTNTIQSGSIVSVSNFGLSSTAFGPVLTWKETWPVKAGFNTYDPYIGLDLFVDGGLDNLVKGFNVQISGANLTVTRAIFLQDAVWQNSGQPSPVFPRYNKAVPASLYGIQNPPKSQMLSWHYPRTNQLYCYDRWFHHDSASMPMMPNWSAYFNGSNYSNAKYVNSLLGAISPWWQDDLSQSHLIFDNTIGFYEHSGSIGVDAPNGYTFGGSDGTQAQVKTKNISFMHAYNSGSDSLGPFSDWLGGSTLFKWQIAPDLAASGSTGQQSLNGSILMNNLLNGSGIGSTNNVLTCQAEQFNALYSLVKAQRSQSVNFSIFNGIADFSGSTGGTDPFPLPTYSPYYTIDSSWNVVPRDAFYMWESGSVYDLSLYCSAVGLPFYSVTGNSSSPNTLYYIKINDAKTFYNNLGVPFVLDNVGYPVSWHVDFSVGTGGWYVSDANGQYLVTSQYYNQAHADICSAGSPCADANQNLMGNQLYIPNATGSATATVVCVQRLNCQDACLSVVPRNYVYRNSSGNYVAVNSVESNAGETHQVLGNGPSGSIGYTFTTNLDYGYIQLTPLG